MGVVPNLFSQVAIVATLMRVEGMLFVSSLVDAVLVPIVGRGAVIPLHSSYYSRISCFAEGRNQCTLQRSRKGFRVPIPH